MVNQNKLDEVAMDTLQYWIMWRRLFPWYIYHLGESYPDILTFFWACSHLVAYSSRQFNTSVHVLTGIFSIINITTRILLASTHCSLDFKCLFESLFLVRTNWCTLYGDSTAASPIFFLNVNCKNLVCKRALPIFLNSLPCLTSFKMGKMPFFPSSKIGEVRIMHPHKLLWKKPVIIPGKKSP